MLSTHQFHFSSRRIFRDLDCIKPDSILMTSVLNNVDDPNRGNRGTGAYGKGGPGGPVDLPGVGL